MITLNDMKAGVIIYKQKTRTFGFNTGVKQGDGLSTTLYIIALHKVIREIDQTGTIFKKLSQICACADDIVLITKTEQKLTQMFDRQETEARKIGMLVNERKTT
jgi:hypothetical protein